MRDFLYVKDAVEMTLHFAEHPHHRRAGFTTSAAARPTPGSRSPAPSSRPGREPAIDFIEMPEVLRGKYQYFTQADITKLRATGYQRPMTPLTEPCGITCRTIWFPGKKLGE
jgi:ADP-L-glycero-D-manno-heptose 6-epimerase